MSPAFQLTINGQPVESALEDRVALKSWQAGEDVALPSGIVRGTDGQGAYVRVEGLSGVVRGEASVYADVLTSGKATELGRSHGFFVEVRGRLINLDDALFGLPALSHATFNRFRMKVQADGLDDFLASTREAVVEEPAVLLFRSYLREQFNTARQFYDNWQEAKEEETLLSTRVGRTAASFSAKPLLEAVRSLLAGRIPYLALVEKPIGLSAEESAALVDRLEEAVANGETLIQSISLEPVGVDKLIASFEPISGTVRVNTLHPFFANFIEESGTHQPFELFAVAEVLTEAYLLEEGMDPVRVQRTIRRRDQFLRELVSTRRLGPAVIAQNLRDQVADEAGLEDAVAAALESLGYEVSRIGGKGKPDGLANASLGAASFERNAPRDDYSLTYDAKSTAEESVATHTIGLSTLARHRRDYKGTFCLVVAVGFEGSDDRNSALGKECTENAVTPVTAQDLALLVEVAAVRQVGFRRLRLWLETCRTPGESRRWIRQLLEEPTQVPPVQQLLDTIAELQRESDDPVELPAVVVMLRERHDVRLQRADVEDLVKSLRSLAPGYISLNGTVVTLETSVDKIKTEIAKHHRQMPEEVLKRSYLLPFLDETTASRPGTGARRPQLRSSSPGDRE
jgi:hypothetical protein